MTLEILPASIQYWDNCLYGGVPVFGTNKTSDVLHIDSDSLRRFVQTRHHLRPLGDVYYQELYTLPMTGWSVLELGSGVGFDSLYFAEHGATITACDVVPSNVKVTQKVLEPYEAKVVLLNTYDDILQLGTFDMIYSHGCLHHIPDDTVSGVVSILCSVLKPGGIALVLVYTKFFYPSVNYHASFGHPEGPFARGYTKAELVDLFGPTMRLETFRILNSDTFAWALFRKIKQDE